MLTTIGPRFSSSIRSPSAAAQITPDEWRTMNATVSAVMVSAAAIRSPFFGVRRAACGGEREAGTTRGRRGAEEEVMVWSKRARRRRGRERPPRVVSLRRAAGTSRGDARGERPSFLPRRLAPRAFVCACSLAPRSRATRRPSRRCTRRAAAPRPQPRRVNRAANLGALVVSFGAAVVACEQARSSLAMREAQRQQHS